MPVITIISSLPERAVGDTVKTHVVLFMHVRTLLDELRDQFGLALLRRMKERVLAAVLAQRRLHFFLCGVVEPSLAELRGAEMSVCIVGGCVGA